MVNRCQKASTVALKMGKDMQIAIGRQMVLVFFGLLVGAVAACDSKSNENPIPRNSLNFIEELVLQSQVFGLWNVQEHIVKERNQPKIASGSVS